MGLPNATAILSTMPGAMRAVISRDDGDVATLAVRSAIHDSGQLSLGGLECDVRTAVWTLAADFDPQIRVGDVLTVDGVKAFVVNAMTSCGALISRAQVILCEDTVIIGTGDPIACHLAMLSQDVVASLAGFSPDDMQGFFIPESLLPDGVTIEQSTPVTIAGEVLTVERVSQSAHHGILCVTCRKHGGAA